MPGGAEPSALTHIFCQEVPGGRLPGGCHAGQIEKTTDGRRRGAPNLRHNPRRHRRVQAAPWTKLRLPRPRLAFPYELEGRSVGSPGNCESLGRSSPAWTDKPTQRLPSRCYPRREDILLSRRIAKLCSPIMLRRPRRNH